MSNVSVKRYHGCEQQRDKRRERKANGAHLCTLQIHVIVSDLEIYSKHVDERDIIATKYRSAVDVHQTIKANGQNTAHITVRGRTSHHEFDA